MRGRVLVTGGTGAHVARALDHAGYDPVAFCRGAPAPLDRLEHIRGDLATFNSGRLPRRGGR